jgi:hypothetical protein
MNSFKVELADKKDDLDLRRILRENYMDGDISLTLQREPDFFNSLSVEGRENQVVIARQIETGKVKGFGVRSIKPCFINGKVIDFGYLSGLRLDREFRNSTLISRGYKFFKKLHNDRKTPAYITTVVEDNYKARELLTSKRAGLPEYHDFGAYISHIVNFGKTTNDKPGFEMRKANLGDLDNILEFLHDEGSKKQFYPSYRPEDFSDSGLLKGLRVGDISIAIDSGEIIGTMAEWDQRKFKQGVVDSYNGRIRKIKPFYNLMAPLFDKPRLTDEGKQIPFIYAGLIATKNNDPEIFRTLLTKTRNGKKNSGLSHLIVGLHERDPLNYAMKDLSSIKFRTRTYIVNWENEGDFFKKLDNRIPYLELGSL